MMSSLPERSNYFIVISFICLPITFVLLQTVVTQTKFDKTSEKVDAFT